MSDFSKAIPFVLKHEGLYSNNPKDPGGPTMYGISLRFLKTMGADGDINKDGVIDIKDIKGIKVEDAMRLYHDSFWEPSRYSKINAQAIATKALDLSVNMGPSVAHKIIQKAVNRLIIEADKLGVDGILGPKSFAAINATKSGPLMAAICLEAEKYYESLVIKNPDLRIFINGWLNRAHAQCGL